MNGYTLIYLYIDNLLDYRIENEHIFIEGTGAVPTLIY